MMGSSSSNAKLDIVFGAETNPVCLDMTALSAFCLGIRQAGIVTLPSQDEITALRVKDQNGACAIRCVQSHAGLLRCLGTQRKSYCRFAFAVLR